MKASLGLVLLLAPVATAQTVVLRARALFGQPP